MKRRIDILVFNNVNILDVAGPAQTFSTVNELGKQVYQMRTISIDGKPVKSSCGIELLVDDSISTPSSADDLLIPGGEGIDVLRRNADVKRFITNWLNARNNRRILSICSGALLLAEAGILDGVRATTHWGREGQAIRDYPNVNWDIDRLYFADDKIMTSAGVTSGIDLSIAVVQRDHGASAALSAARELVVYLQRSGGQHQYSDLLESQFVDDRQLSLLINKMASKLNHKWTLNRMADAAKLTPRTLTRRFAAKLGMSPVKFLERMRVKRASDVMNDGIPQKRVLAMTGFNDSQQLERAFKRQYGISTGEYRQRFSND